MSRTSKCRAKQHTSPPTFRQTLEGVLDSAVSRLWAKARLASRLRHASRATFRFRHARRLGQIKRACISRVMEIAPNHVRVQVDGKSSAVDLLSICCAGRGRLHLPIDAQLPAMSQAG